MALEPPWAVVVTPLERSADLLAVCMDRATGSARYPTGQLAVGVSSSGGGGTMRQRCKKSKIKRYDRSN